MSPERFVKGEAERTLPDLKGITLASFSVYRPCTLRREGVDMYA